MAYQKNECLILKNACKNTLKSVVCSTRLLHIYSSSQSGVDTSEIFRQMTKHTTFGKNDILRIN